MKQSMKYRYLGKTGLRVSEIGFGGEWLERHEESESVSLIKYAYRKGINIIDCWMPDPKSRDIIGQAIAEDRAGWYVQPEVPSSLREHYLSLHHRAGECIGCRGCESRCPFGVKVAGRMARTAELFGE